MTQRPLTLRKVWECSSEEEKDFPLQVEQKGDGNVRVFGEQLIENERGKAWSYVLRDTPPSEDK